MALCPYATPRRCPAPEKTDSYRIDFDLLLRAMAALCISLFVSKAKSRPYSAVFPASFGVLNANRQESLRPALRDMVTGHPTGGGIRQLRPYLPPDLGARF